MAVLLEIVQLLMVGLADESYIAPPAPAELLLKVQLVIAGFPLLLYIPPPSLIAVLLTKVQLPIVGLPLLLYIPPAFARSNAAPGFLMTAAKLKKWFTKATARTKWP